MRSTLALAALAAGALAIPAHASGGQPTPPENCATAVVVAEAGVTNGCDTLGERSIAGGQPARELTLTVLTGRATATLTCGGFNGPTSVTVTLDGSGTGSDILPQGVGSGYCWVTVKSTYPRTTAIASNTETVIFN